VCTIPSAHSKIAVPLGNGNRNALVSAPAVITTTCLAIPCVSTFFSNVFIIALSRLNASTSIACVAFEVDVVARVASSSRSAASFANAFAYTSSSAPSIRRRTAIFARVHAALASSRASFASFASFASVARVVVVVLVVVVVVVIVRRVHLFRASSRVTRARARADRTDDVRADIDRRASSRASSRVAVCARRRDDGRDGGRRAAPRV
jgi:hypothetical protein